MTWKSDVLPTMREHRRAGVEQGLHARDRRPASAPLRRVMPKAQTLACFSASSGDAAKVLGVLLVRGRIAALDVVEAQAAPAAG